MDKFTHDTVEEEIAEYSIRENIAYMSLVAGRLILNKMIPDVPKPILVTSIIQMAETFHKEHGSDRVGDDTVKALSQYAEEKLIEQFRQ